MTAYVDKGVSGAKDKRPALNALVANARRRRFDVLVVWRLDRLGRNLRHLILLLDERTALGITVYAVKPRQCLPIAWLGIVPPGR